MNGSERKRLPLLLVGPSEGGGRPVGPGCRDAMTGSTRSAGPARHDLPAIDEAGLRAARAADRLLAAARDQRIDRWVAFLDGLPDRLRDEPPADLRRTARRARAAYGPKDSIRNSLPEDLTEPFLEAIDRLIRELDRRQASEP